MRLTLQTSAKLNDLDFEVRLRVRKEIRRRFRDDYMKEIKLNQIKRGKMKRMVKVVSITLLIVIICSKGFSQSAYLSDEYWDQAQSLQKQHKYLEAAQMYEKSAKAEKASPKPRLKDLSIAISQAGYCYKKIGQYDKAIKNYEEALAIDRRLGREEGVAIDLNNIGMVYKAWGQYDKAIKNYEKALAIDRRLGREGGIATILSNIGSVYYAWGKYDKAIKNFEEALTIDRRLGREEGVAIRLSNIGMVYDSWGQYDKAIKNYEKALAIDRRLGSEEGVAIDLNNIGMVYKAWGQYDKAIKNYEEALAIAQKLGQKDKIALRLNNIGSVYRAWGRYDKAIKNYEEALAIAQKLEQEDKIATFRNNIGSVYYAWGQYDKAIKNYEETLVIDRRLRREEGVAIDLNNIGKVYDSWGKYDKAIKNFEEALAIDRRLGREGDVAVLLSNIGSVHYSWGQYDKAIKNFEEALAIDRRLEREGDVARGLNNIGMVYDSWAQYDKAIKNYEEALAIDRRLGREGDVATILNNIGMVYKTWGQYDKAIKNYEEALAIDRRLEREGDVALRLNNIGGIYYTQKNYSKAITYFEESVETKEKLRKTATGDVRRDYLASQIYTYQYLTSTYIRNNDLHNAFHTIELSRAKLLAEQLAGSETEVTIPSVKQIQKGMSENITILVYTNVDWDNITLVTITKDDIYGEEISTNSFVSTAMERYETAVQTMLKNQRGMKKIAKKEKKKELAGPVAEKDDFENIINYYRDLLTNPSIENNEKAKEISRMLYDFLVKPILSHINDKNELIIIPDGVLGFLPFETLIDEKERYLVENYHIIYTQSVGVLELIKSRHYEHNRKPLLAFGGAVYDKITYVADMVKNERELAFLEKNVYLDFVRRGTVRNAYGSLGVGNWDNLPGTLSEVMEIKNVVNGSEIITGEKVTENKIKALSSSGSLTKYKVLHFATHGLVVPTVPELSAVVLSQFVAERENEDGYLRMGEIAELDLRADFVNLSACETGLGKIYGGEGVVGLTQSFLIAGANGLSVSLWQVADISTSKFMVSMYELVKEQDIGYANAISEVKRKFIRGDFGSTYQAPYYWAPFVYYGK